MKQSSGESKDFTVRNISDRKVAAAASLNKVGEPLSMMEKTAYRILPIIIEVQKKLIQESKLPSKKSSTETFGGMGFEAEFRMDDEDLISKGSNECEADMRSVLGFFNQSDLVEDINISSIMLIKPVKMSDLLDINRNET